MRIAIGIVLALALYRGTIATHAPDTKPQPAEEVMNAAKKTAQKRHRPIFLMFDASW